MRVAIKDENRGEIKGHEGKIIREKRGVKDL